jgi:tetratricopeptide (TPR) repeat protein
MLKPTLQILVLLLLIPCSFISFGQDSKQYIDSLNHKASDVYYLNADSGMMLAQKAVRLSEMEGYQPGLAEAYSLLAIGHADISEFKTSFDYLAKAISIAEEFEDETLKMNVYIRVGVVYYENYILDKATEIWLKVLDMSRVLEDKETIAKTLSNIGVVFYEKDDMNEALKYFEQSLMIFEQLKMKNMIEITLGNIGNIYSKQSKYDMALDYFLRKEAMLDMAEKEHVIWNHVALARVYIQLKNKTKARQYLKKIEASMHAKTKSTIKTDYYELLGSFSLLNNDSIKGIEYYKKSINLADSLALFSKMQGVSQQLSVLLKERKDFKNALFYSELQKTAADSALQRANLEKVLQLKANHEYKQFQEELLAKNKRDRLITIAIVLMLLIIIAAVVFLMMKHKQRASAIYLDKKKIEENLKDKEQEILTKSLQLTEREELMKKMEQKLTALAKNAKKANVPAIRELIVGIRQSKSDNIFQELEQRFQVINGDFLDRLKAEFPELTPRELLVCSYLRLNMSSKEIAMITHQSPESVNKARFRLRKKLNLNKSEVNLTEYMINY